MRQTNYQNWKEEQEKTHIEDNYYALKSQMHEALRVEYDKKVDEIEKQKEETLFQAYSELKRVNTKNIALEESFIKYEKELKKAHIRLAKKIKENTLLRDAFDRQKAKITELQNLLQNRKIENENSEKNL